MSLNSSFIKGDLCHTDRCAALIVMFDLHNGFPYLHFATTELGEVNNFPKDYIV